MALFTALLLTMISPNAQLLAPLHPIPSAEQIAWQKMETNAFIHFGPNTFTDVEWGGGKEDPNLFAPSHLDCNQWVKALKAGGIKGVIITAKHHDGFCLWPSKLSSHTVAQSGWRGGKGDVLKELSEACHKEGLKFGVYLSPWDRNHPTYGTPAYNQTFVGMLKEVLTHYGPVFEVWFDGANGEGPNGKRQVYDWPLFNATVKKYQPHAVIFSDAGPDLRWVGNEEGIASETSWSTIPSGRYVPGTPYSSELGEGQEGGDLWVTPECDVSIRPGWFYHQAEDGKVKSPETLFDLYEKSVGRNSLLLLNVPPNRQGLISEADIQALLGFRKLVTKIYGTSLSSGAHLTSSSHFIGHDLAQLSKKDGFWAASSEDSEPTITLALPTPISFNRVVLGEPIALGQRVKSFTVQAKLVTGDWKTIASGTTIGRRRMVSFEEVSSSEVRLRLNSFRACPAVSEFGLYTKH